MNREELSKAELACLEYYEARQNLFKCGSASEKVYLTGKQIHDQLDKTITVEIPEPVKVLHPGALSIKLRFKDLFDRDKAEQAIASAIKGGE